MESFCTKSWKMNAFNLKGAQHVTFQMLSGALIFFQLYLSIMSAVESRIANVFSIFVALYSLVTLFCYFGIKESRAIEAFQSDAASLFLGAVAFGHLIVSVSNGNGVTQFGYSFLILSQVLCADAFYGFMLQVAAPE